MTDTATLYLILLLVSAAIAIQVFKYVADRWVWVVYYYQLSRWWLRTQWAAANGYAYEPSYDDYEDEYQPPILQEWPKERKQPEGLYLFEEAETGRRFGLNLASGHGGIFGMTGSGKGNTLQLIILLALLDREQPKIVVLDRKAGLDYSSFVDLKNFELFRTAEAGDTVTAGLDAQLKEMVRRNELLFKSKQRNINEYNKKFPTKKLQRILVIADEFKDFLPEQKERAEKLAAMSRAAGFTLVFSTQQPLAAHIPTGIQAQFDWRMVNRVANSKMILVATGVAKAAEVEISPVGLERGQAVRIDDLGWRLVNIPFVDTESRDAVLERIQENAAATTGTPSSIQYRPDGDIQNQSGR